MMDQKIKTSNVTYSLATGTMCGISSGFTEHAEQNKQNQQPDILCLHGWLDNAASFLPLMSALPEQHIIAVDWPGHGFSEHRSVDAYYHFVDWVYDLLLLFEANEWQQVDIVAHSMGGMVASAFAAAFPEKVKSLTLIDSIGFLCIEPEKSTEQLRKGMLSRLKSSINQPRPNSISSIMPSTLPKKKKSLHATTDSAIKARVNVSDLSYENAELIVNRGIVKVEGGYTWRSDSRLRLVSPYRFTLDQGKQLVQDIQCPVQLVYGSKGLDLVSEGVKSFSTRFKQLSTAELAGGHHVHMEQPEALSQLIRKFLTK